MHTVLPPRPRRTDVSTTIPDTVPPFHEPGLRGRRRRSSAAPPGQGPSRSCATRARPHVQDSSMPADGKLTLGDEFLRASRRSTSRSARCRVHFMRHPRGTLRRRGPPTKADAVTPWTERRPRRARVFTPEPLRWASASSLSAAVHRGGARRVLALIDGVAEPPHGDPHVLRRRALSPSRALTRRSAAGGTSSPRRTSKMLFTGRKAA